MARGFAVCCLAGLAGHGAAAEEWRFRLTPYLWAAGLEGDVSTLPGAPVAPIDLSFRDVLDNLDFGAFAVAVARRGDLALFADVQAVLTTQDLGAAGPVAGGSLASDTYFATLGAGWTVWRGAGGFVDLDAGVRVWRIDTALTLNLADGSRRRVDSDETFVDPVIGVSGEMALSPRWSAVGSATLAGFGVGSEISYGATVALRYAAGERWGLTAGYRYLAVDYDDGGFVYDVAQQGVLLGAYVDF